MGFTRLDNVLWLAGFVGHVLLFSVLLRQSSWKRFPVFVGLIGYEAFVSIALFLAARFGTADVYFLCYWALALIDYAFQIGLLIEIARNVFPGSTGWVFSRSNGIGVLTLGAICMTGGLCLLMAPRQVVGLELWEERVTLFTSLLTCELYVAISLRANLLRLQWQDHVIAIGRGLALWSGAAVLGDVLHAMTGWNSGVAAFDHFRMIVYLVDLVYWSWIFLKPDRPSQFNAADLEQLLATRYEPARRT